MSAVAMRAAAAAAMCALVLGGAGCASSSYVVLLPNEDGSVGKVEVSGRNGPTRLDRARVATQVGGATGNTFTLEDDRFAREFGPALAATARPPAGFLLYFDTGGTRLTQDSLNRIPSILEAVAQRPAADISVIGHTDTVDDALRNDALGRERAQNIAELIRQRVKTRVLRIAVESHGEKNLLVPTADNVDEPRNRRVEVTVR